MFLAFTAWKVDLDAIFSVPLILATIQCKCYLLFSLYLLSVTYGVVFKMLKPKTSSCYCVHKTNQVLRVTFTTFTFSQLFSCRDTGSFYCAFSTLPMKSAPFKHRQLATMIKRRSADTGFTTTRSRK